MRVVLSGGGTGGHIYPALALRKELLKHYPDAEFLYVGTAKGLESRIVPSQNIPFKTIHIQGLKRSFSLENLKTVTYMLESIRVSKRYLKGFQPDIVIGTGGYVCAPVLYAAARLGIPTVIHEQNSVAGITNKFLSRYVDKICICYEEVKESFSKKAQRKIVFTGNPRAQEVAERTEKPDLTEFGLRNDRPTLLIFGGSRGAQRINQVVEEMLPELKDQPYQTLIATGEIYYKELMARYPDIQQMDKVKVVSYIHNMPSLLRKVDLVVCRSGATTLTELTAVGTPSILIPSPNVTNNHQQHNAESLAKRDAAIMILEENLSAHRLLTTIDDLMSNPGKCIEMSHQSKKMSVPDASDRIISVIEKLIK